MTTTASTALRRPTKPSSTSNTTKAAWTTARCHRVLRPLSSKLRALETITQTLPSMTVAVGPTKGTKVDPAELPYKPSADSTRSGLGKKRHHKPATTDRDLFFGRPTGRGTVRRTYSGMRAGGAAGATHRNQNTATSATTTPVAEDSPSSEPAATELRGGAKDLEGSVPQQLLNSLKPYVHPSIFSIYSGICSALETLLVSTAPPESQQTSPRSLTVLAARKVAHCILATSSDLDNDDIWYDHSSQIGASGEYLREIVRWHGIELIREAIRFNYMATQKNGLGLASVLVGLCKQHGATAEAESLLQSMFELRPLSTNSNDPAFATLVMFWKDSPDAFYRITGENMVSEGTPVALGNSTINALLKDALGDIEHHEPSRRLVTKAFESAFGIWGEEHIDTMRLQRKEQNRRKGSRLSSQRSEDVKSNRSNKSLPPLPVTIGNRAETMALDMVESLVPLSLNPANTAASAILSNLVQGFTLQSASARTASEEAWEASYPIAAKVLILAQSVSRVDDPDLNKAIVRELSRSLSDVRDASGKEGLQSVGEYIARCYFQIYDADSGKSTTEKDELKLLVSRLVSAASEKPETSSSTLPAPASTASSLPTATPLRPPPAAIAFTPTTPFVANNTLITFTPASAKPPSSRRIRNVSQSSNSISTADRYFISRLALNIAIEFSTLQNRPSWTAWVQKIEHRVLGLKLQTPAPPRPPPPSFSNSYGADKHGAKPAPYVEGEKKKRKGWRWEEGISEWVAVGYTPGKQVHNKVKSSTITADTEHSTSASSSDIPSPAAPSSSTAPTPAKRRAGAGIFLGICLPTLAPTQKKEYASIVPCNPTSSPVRTPCRSISQRQFSGFADDVFTTPARTSPSALDHNVEEDEEDPETSYSRLFEGGHDDDETDVSSAYDSDPEPTQKQSRNRSHAADDEEQFADTDVDSDDDDDDDERNSDFYAPTPMKPPQSVRRSPRSIARIRRSLHKPLFGSAKRDASLNTAAAAANESPVKSGKRKRVFLETLDSDSEAEEMADDDQAEADDHSDSASPPPKKRSRVAFAVAALSQPRSSNSSSASHPQPLKELSVNGHHHLRQRPQPQKPVTRQSPRKGAQKVSYTEPEMSEDELAAPTNHASAAFGKGKGRRRRGLVMMRGGRWCGSGA